MTLVWAVPMERITDKLVLLGIADNCSDEGHCWPSIKALYTKCSMSERAVQGAIRRLVEMGLVQVTEKTGHSHSYFVDPQKLMAVTPAGDAPPQRVHPARRAPTPARRAPPPPQEMHPGGAGDAPITIIEPSFEPSLNRKRAAPATATRLPADWKLTPDRRAYAEQQGLDPTRVFENFTDYWAAASGASARKHDWDAAWRVWCRKDADRPAYNGHSTKKYIPPLSSEELEALERQNANV